MSVSQSTQSRQERNKALVRRVIEEVWNGRNVEVLDQLFAPGGESAVPDRHRAGTERMKHWLRLYGALAPDLHVTIDQLLAEGDAVMVRWTARGTHTGSVPGLSPADVLGQVDGGFHLRLLSTIHPDGRRLSFDGVSVFEITSGGQVASFWALLDEVEVLSQLGALPALGPTN